RAHRDLHSFPTRRSSDLARRPGSTRSCRPDVVEPSVPRVIGVIGAGTMGAGIAQLACLQARARTLLHDPVPDALARGVEGVEHQDRKSTRLNSSHRTISY